MGSKICYFLHKSIATVAAVAGASRRRHRRHRCWRSPPSPPSPPLPALTTVATVATVASARRHRCRRLPPSPPPSPLAPLLALAPVAPVATVAGAATGALLEPRQLLLLRGRATRREEYHRRGCRFGWRVTAQRQPSRLRSWPMKRMKRKTSSMSQLWPTAAPQSARGRH